MPCSFLYPNFFGAFLENAGGSKPRHFLQKPGPEAKLKVWEAAKKVAFKKIHFKIPDLELGDIRLYY